MHSTQYSVLPKQNGAFVLCAQYLYRLIKDALREGALKYILQMREFVYSASYFLVVHFLLRLITLLIA